MIPYNQKQQIITIIYIWRLIFMAKRKKYSKRKSEKWINPDIQKEEEGKQRFIGTHEGMLFFKDAEEKRKWEKENNVKVVHLEFRYPNPSDWE